jgi:alpha-tubulin suppressor-like RCC1 family protein
MRRSLVLLTTLCVILVTSCRDATQVDVVLRTNVPYATGVGVAVWSGRSSVAGAPLVEASEPWLGDGEVGNVIVTPGDAARDGKVTVRVAMGLRGRPASSCTDQGDPKDCIVARRKLSFAAFKRLKLPVVLYLSCEGILCSADTTCSHLGRCVPAEIDPATCAGPDGCTLPGEPPFVPGVPREAGAADADASQVVPQQDGGPSDANSSDGADAGSTAATPEVVAGAYHTCARLDEGAVKCWGRNENGQLGLGDTEPRGDGPNEMGPNLPAIDLGPGRSALELAVAPLHTCARLDNGQVKCWGHNTEAQLGLGDRFHRGDGPGEMGGNLPPVDLGPGRTALQIVGGAIHTCARLDDSTVKCWGAGNGGQLGLGDLVERGSGPGEMGANLPPVDFGPGRTAVQLAAGDVHSCARLENGSVKCWGNNFYGQLGLGDSQARGGAPAQMGANLPAVNLGPGRSAVDIASKGNHTCARLDDGSTKCWGQNDGAQLGDGTLQDRGTQPAHMGVGLAALDLGPGRTVLQIAPGYRHTCALLDNGAVKCWGQASAGQLGSGDTQARGDQLGEMGASLPVVDLGPGRLATRLTAGVDHTCARLDNADIKCWGDNNIGQLGLGDALNRGGTPGSMGAGLAPVPLK